MSFLKQLLRPFVEFDDEKKKGQQQGVQPTPPQGPKTEVPPAPEENVQHPLITANAPAADPIPTYAPTGTLAEPLPEHEAYFDQLIDQANAQNPLFQGTDYKEFVDSKLDIDDIKDEALKYRTAYNVLKSTGLSKEKLLSTGQEYINLIGRDMNAFQSAHAQQYGNEVRQKELQIQKKAEELQVLAQRINELKAEINNLTQDVNLTKDKLNTIRQSFLLAGEKKQKEIESELQKIAQYF